MEGKGLRQGWVEGSHSGMGQTQRSTLGQYATGLNRGLEWTDQVDAQQGCPPLFLHLHSSRLVSVDSRASWTLHDGLMSG